MVWCLSFLKQETLQVLYFLLLFATLSVGVETVFHYNKNSTILDFFKSNLATY